MQSAISKTLLGLNSLPGNNFTRLPGEVRSTSKTWVSAHGFPLPGYIVIATLFFFLIIHIFRIFRQGQEVHGFRATALNLWVPYHLCIIMASVGTFLRVKLI